MAKVAALEAEKELLMHETERLQEENNAEAAKLAALEAESAKFTDDEKQWFVCFLQGQDAAATQTAEQLQHLWRFRRERLRCRQDLHEGVCVCSCYGRATHLPPQDGACPFCDGHGSVHNSDAPSREQYPCEMSEGNVEETPSAPALEMAPKEEDGTADAAAETFLAVTNERSTCIVPWLRTLNPALETLWLISVDLWQ